MNIDKASFIYGMVTAFCECVANESKKLAFSPPLTSKMYSEVKDEVKRIVLEMGLRCFFESNQDVDNNDIGFFVIYKFHDVIDEYHHIRYLGFNAINDFDKFKSILSYGNAFLEGMREESKGFKTVDRVLFDK